MGSWRLSILLLFALPAAAWAVDGHYARLPSTTPDTWGPRTARSLGRKPGERITVDCSANGYAAPVWGDGLYTDESSVCTAAVHAGLIDFDEGGRIAIELAAGRQRYGGKLRNRVQSEPYGASEGSFFFPDALRFNPERTGKPMRIDWGNTASPWRGEVGRRMQFDCQPRAATRDPDGNALLAPVFGTDVYRDDSSICAAALHAGQITEEGGIVTIEIARADESFASSNRNGIASRPAPRSAGGFVFPGAPPPARVALPAPEAPAPTPEPVRVTSVSTPVARSTWRSKPAPPAAPIDWGTAPRPAVVEPAPIPAFTVDASVTEYTSLSGRSIDPGFAPGIAIAARAPITARLELGAAMGWRQVSGTQPRHLRELAYDVDISLVPVEAIARASLVRGIGLQAGVGIERASSRSKKGAEADFAAAGSFALSASREARGGAFAASAGVRFGRHSFASHDVETGNALELVFGYSRRF